MTNKITYLDDNEFCIIKKDQVLFFNEDGKKINKKILDFHQMRLVTKKVILSILWQKKLRSNQQQLKLE